MLQGFSRGGSRRAPNELATQGCSVGSVPTPSSSSSSPKHLTVVCHLGTDYGRSFEHALCHENLECDMRKLGTKQIQPARGMRLVMAVLQGRPLGGGPLGHGGWLTTPRNGSIVAVDAS